MNDSGNTQNIHGYRFFYLLNNLFNKFSLQQFIEELTEV